MTSDDEAHGVKVRFALVMATINLFHYNDVNDFIRPDRLRRVVVVHSVTGRDSDIIDVPPLHQDSLC